MVLKLLRKTLILKLYKNWKKNIQLFWHGNILQISVSVGVVVIGTSHTCPVYPVLVQSQIAFKMPTT